MRILHIASFNGNVGDNANHNGLRSKLKDVFHGNICYEELEIRKAYKNYYGKDKLKFDDQFADKVNSYDLAIIGGGNFFEIWIEDSSTGCTIDIPIDILKKIKTKIIFFGLGFDTYKGFSENAINKFYNFFNYILSTDQYLVSVRNDGSINQITNIYGRSLADKVIEVPDGGFFTQLDKDEFKNLPAKESFNIILSIAEDMLDLRLPKMDETRALNLLVHSYVNFIIEQHEKNKNICFYLMPHIYTDIHIIYEIIKNLPTTISRNVVNVGPYLIGQGAEKEVFSYYLRASCVISMRFHGNVVPIGFNIPTIGISTYKKIFDLYEELDLTDRVITVENKFFNDDMNDKLDYMIRKKDNIKQQNLEMNKNLENMMGHFLKRVKEFIS